jgi:hypothetical protein
MKATMRRSAQWGTLTAALVLLVSSGAHADDKATREAEARFAEGLARVKTKDYEAARLSFEQAYAVLHRPLILWNLALSEEMTAHSLDALAHFRQVAREAAGESDRASAQKHVDALLMQLSRIDVQAPPGTTFALDGSALPGAAPIGEPLDVTPGHHVIEARIAAGAAKTSEVDAIAGQVAHVTFAADAPTPVAAAVAPAALTPAPVSQTSEGPAADVATASKPFWTPRTVTAATLVGVGVVAVGFGAGFGLASRSNQKTAQNYQSTLGRSFCLMPGPADQNTCTTWNNAVNAQNRDANISDALYFAAGAFAVGAVVSWFFWPKPVGAKAAWVAPVIGPGTVGIGTGGDF